MSHIGRIDEVCKKYGFDVSRRNQTKFTRLKVLVDIKHKLFVCFFPKVRTCVLKRLNVPSMILCSLLLMPKFRQYDISISQFNCPYLSLKGCLQDPDSYDERALWIGS